eukprot:Em0019g433a
MSNSSKSALPQKKNCMALQMVRCESQSMSPTQLEANRRKKELEMAEERKKKQSMNVKANRKNIESLDSTPRGNDLYLGSALEVATLVDKEDRAKVETEKEVGEMEKRKEDGAGEIEKGECVIEKRKSMMGILGISGKEEVAAGISEEASFAEKKKKGGENVTEDVGLREIVMREEEREKDKGLDRGREREIVADTQVEKEEVATVRSKKVEESVRMEESVRIEDLVSVEADKIRESAVNSNVTREPVNTLMERKGSSVEVRVGEGSGEKVREIEDNRVNPNMAEKLHSTETTVDPASEDVNSSREGDVDRGQTQEHRNTETERERCRDEGRWVEVEERTIPVDRVERIVVEVEEKEVTAIRAEKERKSGSSPPPKDKLGSTEELLKELADTSFINQIASHHWTLLDSCIASKVYPLGMKAFAVYKANDDLRKQWKVILNNTALELVEVCRKHYEKLINSSTDKINQLYVKGEQLRSEEDRGKFQRKRATIEEVKRRENEMSKSRRKKLQNTIRKHKEEGVFVENCLVEKDRHQVENETEVRQRSEKERDSVSKRPETPVVRNITAAPQSTKTTSSEDKDTRRWGRTNRYPNFQHPWDWWAAQNLYWVKGWTQPQQKTVEALYTIEEENRPQNIGVEGNNNWIYFRIQVMNNESGGCDFSWFAVTSVNLDIMNESSTKIP